MKSIQNMFKPLIYGCFCHPLKSFPSYSIVSLIFLISYSPFTFKFFYYVFLLYNFFYVSALFQPCELF
nr:MAG TPA: hypothetical protein [Caudoviricetes sp.]